MGNHAEVEKAFSAAVRDLLTLDGGDAVLQRVLANTSLVASSGPRGRVGTQVQRMAANQRATPSPNGRNVDAEAAPVVTASGGQVISSRDELAERMSSTLQRMQREDAGRRFYCAEVRWANAYPEHRTLHDGDVHGNTQKIEAVCGAKAPRFDKGSGALVATGGVCLPTNVDYSVPVWSSADRPLRDALPSFQATRGGIQFVTPPDIGVVSLQGGTASGAGVATGIWTEATDANPAGQTKPVWTVACGTPQQVYVDAIPTRVQFGNMESRFAPEQIAANTEQAINTAAREAELNLLAKMYAASNQVLPAAYLGASRDILASVDLLAEQYRYSHRYPRGIGLTAVLPEWSKGLFRADLARELAHDNAGNVNVLALSDAVLEDWFSVRGIDVVWTMEGLQAGTYGTGGSAIPNQYFAKVTAGAAPQWPGQTGNGSVVVAWLLFVTGTFQFLDGGRLDLGVVRDSLLDATNDYETFVETFEAIAFRGNEVYQVQSTVKPNGGSAGSIATSGYAE